MVSPLVSQAVGQFGPVAPNLLLTFQFLNCLSGPIQVVEVDPGVEGRVQLQVGLVEAPSHDDTGGCLDHSHSKQSFVTILLRRRD